MCVGFLAHQVSAEDLSNASKRSMVVIGGCFL